MKIREVINLRHWVSGSGFSHTETYSDSIIEISGIPEEMDWSWWDADEENEGNWDDIEIVVQYFAEDDEDMENPLGEWSVWESDLKA